MRHLFVIGLSLLVLAGCGEDSTEYVYKPLDVSPLPSCTKKYEGVYANSNDSVFLCNDGTWVHQSFLDTIIQEKIDTLVQIDTVVIQESIPLYSNSLVINKCRTDFDSPFVPGKSFFFGNSLVGGFDSFGMAASNNTKDYIANLTDYFKKRDIDFSPQKKSSNFENMQSLEEQSTFLHEEILSKLDSSTGLVVIQLGDNVNEEPEFLLFRESIANLLNQICGKAPNAKVMWVGEWYSTASKQKTIKEVADLFEIPFLDISDVNTTENQSYIGAVYTYPNTRNFSISADSIKENNDSLLVYFSVGGTQYLSVIVPDSYDWDEENKTLEWKGTDNIITDPAVASHPNDKAFKEIARRILLALGYEL